MTHMGRVSPPFSLVQNRTDDFGASFAHLRRSALQPSPQCTATTLAVHCIRQDLFGLSSYLVWVGVKFSNAKEEELLINDASQIGSKKFDFSIE